MKNFIWDKSTKFTAFVAAIMICISSISTALFGVMLGRLVTNVAQSNLVEMKQSIIFCLLILLLSFISSNIGRRAVISHALNRTIKLRNKVFGNDLRELRGEAIDLAGFTTKSSTVYVDYFVAIWEIFESGVLFVSAVFAIIYIDWIMLIVAIISSLFPMLVPVLMGKKLEAYSISYNDAGKSYLAFVTDVLKGRMEIIKNHVFDTYNKKHERENFTYETLHYKNVAIQNLANYLGELLGGFSFFILFAIGGILVYRGRIEIGGIIACIQLFNYLINPVMRISNTANRLKAAKPIYKELLEKANKSNAPKDVEIVKNIGDLNVSSISFSYNDENNCVLNNFSKSFESGKKYLIQGRSGVGKSTLAKLLTGELIPNSGSIKLNGRPLTKYSEDERLQYIHYVDQSSYLFNDTIQNNITLYRDVEIDKLNYLKENLSISDLSFEDVVNDELGLSGGQKSRINIARSLITQAPIYIFDEPTAALDHETALRVMNFLLGRKETIIIISHIHDSDIKELFDEVITLD